MESTPQNVQTARQETPNNAPQGPTPQEVNRDFTVRGTPLGIVYLPRNLIQVPEPKQNSDGSFEYDLELSPIPYNTKLGRSTFFLSLFFFIFAIGILIDLFNAEVANKSGIILSSIGSFIIGYAILKISRWWIYMQLNKEPTTLKTIVFDKQLISIPGRYGSKTDYYILFNGISIRFKINRTYWHLIEKGDNVVVSYYPNLEAIKSILLSLPQKRELSNEDAITEDRDATKTFRYILDIFFIIIVVLGVFVLLESLITH